MSERIDNTHSEAKHDTGAEVITFTQARERSRKIRLARQIREGSYKPDINALAGALMRGANLQR